MKKTIYGLILAVFFGFYIFFGNELGGVNAKALTVDDIQTADDLRGTSWILNYDINLRDLTSDKRLIAVDYQDTQTTYGTYEFSDQVITLNSRGTETSNRLVEVNFNDNGAGTKPRYTNALIIETSNSSYFALYNADYYGTTTTQWSEFWISGRGEEPRRLTFYSWNDGAVVDNGGVINWLKQNATFQQPEPEEYQVEIDWPILEETMILTQGETVTINFDELMETYKNYEYVDITWSYNDNGIGDITLPLYYKLTGFYLTNTPVYSEDLFFDSGTLTFTQNIYLWAVSEPPENYIFTKFSYIDDSLEGSVEDGYNMLIPFSDNEVNINWTYDDDMIVDITGLEGFKIAISRFDETSIDIIEYSYSSPHSIQFYINKLGYYFNKVEANAYRYWYNTNTSPWEPPYLNDYYKFNPQEDIEYYDLTNRSTNISVYDDEPTAILYITQEVNYNYEGGGNEGDQLNGAMITFFSLITGLINLKFGFISIGGILAILFGVALLTFIFKIWNGNNNG